MKAMKFHLRRVVGEQRLTFEELSTILCQVEACLNSRPLAPLNRHPDDGIDVLIPSHFLIGRHLQALPLSPDKLPLLKRWTLFQAIILEALVQRIPTTATEAYKVEDASRHLKSDDLILIKEDSLVSTHWQTGQILQTFPGQDGKVRVATVRTTAGVYKWPITKLVLLLPHEP